ncbi:MAG: 50S ribosomal protein L30e [Fervidicoccaceae archaeon]|jgi:large subunit ribosomal protein L30e|uniref:Large ribosomal subunit protein eL30 n=1 Tax=Fervidicoccus fontis TaxID=683846 RepID=A0A7C2UJV0_9CREN|nr:MAG: 50S ribosomal protein L30e [Fervidicoccus sp.]HEU98042.1 50S ribosomal protein L30e [Fervidicoccus fontis]
MTNLETELKNALKTGKVILGSKESISVLKHGKAKMVIVATNAEPSTRKDVEYYAKLSNIPIYVFEGTSVDLGAILGKPFPIQVIAVVDPGESKVIELVEN